VKELQELRANSPKKKEELTTRLDAIKEEVEFYERSGQNVSHSQPNRRLDLQSEQRYDSHSIRD